MISRRNALIGSGAAIATLAGGHVIAAEQAGSGSAQEGLSAYAVNVESWWDDLPFLDRFAKAAEAGFTTVEMWPTRQEGRSPQQIRERLDDTGLSIVQSLAWYGPGLTDVSQHQPFVEAMKRAVEDGELLGIDMFTVVGHQDDPALSLADKLGRLRDAYEAALPVMEESGKMMITEPFNEFDHPGHFIYGSPEALELCRAVDSPHLKINWDLFHMQRHEGELIQRFRDGIDQVGYVQLADNPGRNQPGTGELNYARIFAEIRKAGYDGYFGLECWPVDGDEAAALQAVKAVAP